jgi:hypothetical protein
VVAPPAPAKKRRARGAGVLRALTDRPQTTRELLAILQARIGDDISTQKVSRTLVGVLGDRVQRDELVSSFAANKKVSVYRLIGDTREYTPTLESSG